jgi:hypothetical protein
LAPRGSYFLAGILDPTSDTDQFAGALSCVWTVDPGLAYEPPPAPGSETIYYESFDDTPLDPLKWSPEFATTSLVVKNGELQMSGAGNRFPYIRSARAIVPFYGDFQADIRFRYPFVGTCGVGFMLTTVTPIPGLSQEVSAAQQKEAEKRGAALGVWQDRNGMQLWYRSGADRKDIWVGGINTAMHTMSVDYSWNRYKLYLDGSLMYTSAPTFYRPQRIWIGNPIDLGPGNSCDWDTLHVDSIRVTRPGVAH